MNLQEFCDLFNVYAARDKGQDFFDWYSARPEWEEELWMPGDAAPYGRIPPSVECPDLPPKKSLICPKPDPTKLVKDQPLIVWDSGVGMRRYFAKYEDGRVYAYAEGKTSWSSRDVLVSFSSWENWRLPTPEELEDVQ